MNKRGVVVLRRWLELGLEMDRNGIVAEFLLLLIVADASNASFISKFRTLAAANSNKIQISPSPSPGSVQQMDTNSNTTTSNKTKSEDSNSNASDKSTPKVFDSKGLKNVTDKVGPTPQNRTQNDQTNKEQQEKKHNDETYSEERKEGTNKTDSDSEPHQAAGLNCTGVSGRCTDLDSLIACILNFDPGTKQSVVLVQNDGESFLRVDLSAPNPLDDALIELNKHKSKKITLTVGYRNEVILRAGHGECVLHVDPRISEGNFFFNLPSYDKIITPINGVCFVILTVIVFGGSWACCMFKKRGQRGGIPYQELEMGMPANGAKTAEGWDQGWDDDWDEENAVKSPVAHRAGNISANGLTSRAVNKDGWENDWDD